ncbi:MAG: amino acid ABC transporter permease [Aquificaceae bacterium]|nr:MAG: amino acid ABC transporter permease [Aquificaceae bacterium]
MSKHNSELKPSKPPIWNDPKYRALFIQSLLTLGLLYFIYAIVQNTLGNMESRGISTGFAFMSEPAGFDILQSLIPFNSDSTYGRTFVVGILNTLLITVLGVFFATILGFIIGVARLSKNWLIAKLATVYIETFRNIPLLIQIFFWYFVVLRAMPSARESMSLFDSFFLNVRGLYLPAPVTEPGFMYTTIAFVIGLIGTFILRRWAKKRQEATGQPFPVFLSSLGLIILLPLIVFFISGSPLTWDIPSLQGFNFKGGLSVIPELFALLIALSIYTAAFIAEIVRSGIKAVSHGQTEAALSIGLTPTQNLRLVVIPQAMRVIIPPMTSQYLNLAKNSSLATAIGYPDIVAVFMGTTLNQTGQAVEIIAMTMAVYLVLSLSISAFMNWYNAKMSLVER